MSIPSVTHNQAFRRTWLPSTSILVLALAMLAIGFVTQGTNPTAVAAAPIAHCNSSTASNVGGQGVACTVTVDNYVTGAGSLEATAPSTIVVTACTGAAGVIASGGGTCNTTTTTSAEPITSIAQCNFVGNGGGGVVICTVRINNHFDSVPASAPTAARVYQCVGSVITGTGAPGTCSPANTPGVTSIGAATVGQCNGSGNGGTSVGFTCTVTGSSTTTERMPVNINQCNDSANGGGSLVICRSTVTNDVIANAPTATPAGVNTSTPIVPVDSTPGASATAVPPVDSTPTAIVPPLDLTPTPVGTPPVELTPTPFATPPLDMTPTPVGPFVITTPTPLVPGTPPADTTPGLPMTGTPAPGAPNTGTGASTSASTSVLPIVAGLALLLGSTGAMALKRNAR